MVVLPHHIYNDLLLLPAKSASKIEPVIRSTSKTKIKWIFCCCHFIDNANDKPYTSCAQCCLNVRHRCFRSHFIHNTTSISIYLSLCIRFEHQNTNIMRFFNLFYDIGLVWFGSAWTKRTNKRTENREKTTEWCCLISIYENAKSRRSRIERRQYLWVCERASVNCGFEVGLKRAQVQQHDKYFCLTSKREMNRKRKRCTWIIRKKGKMHIVILRRFVINRIDSSHQTTHAWLYAVKRSKLSEEKVYHCPVAQLKISGFYRVAPVAAINHRGKAAIIAWCWWCGTTRWLRKLQCYFMLSSIKQQHASTQFHTLISPFALTQFTRHIKYWSAQFSMYNLIRYAVKIVKCNTSWALIITKLNVLQWKVVSRIIIRTQFTDFFSRTAQLMMAEKNKYLFECNGKTKITIDLFTETNSICFATKEKKRLVVSSSFSTDSSSMLNVPILSPGSISSRLFA